MKIDIKKIREKRTKMRLSLNNRIEINPKIALGKPVIYGTRITVNFVLKLFAEGMDHNEILKEYPQLEKEDLLAVLNYAKNLVQEERVYPLIKAKTTV